MTAAARGDTIFALSSGAPPAAIAIVRISGGEAATALRTLAGNVPAPRTAALRELRDARGELLDRALLLWFPRPASATGEDLAELHLHGGRAVVTAVLAALAALPGLRTAEPGEFTRRALANGRIDLLQAEGLADLLEAETEAARRRALHAAEGGMSALVGQWRETLLALSARAEALLDFEDDEADVLPDPRWYDDVAGFAEELARALRQPPAERLRDGFRIVIAGPPNSGKSTLFNKLVGREAAIISPEAGTTRDLLEAPVSLSGRPALFIDSAGIRQTEGLVEQAGIERAHSAIETADLLLWMGKPGDCPGHTNRLRLHGKLDRPGRRRVPDDVDIAISAVDGTGIEQLRQMIRAYVDLHMAGMELALGERQRFWVARAWQALTAIEPDQPIEVAADLLRSARESLNALLSDVSTDDMLDTLFSRFCVGK